MPMNGTAVAPTMNSIMVHNTKDDNHLADNKHNDDGVATPTAQDILMGRGNSHKNHPGNVIFQGTYSSWTCDSFCTGDVTTFWLGVV